MSKWKVIMDNGSEYIVSATDKSGAIHMAIKEYHIVMEEVEDVKKVN